MWNISKVNNKDIRTTPMRLFWYLYCKLWTYFTPCCYVSFVNFEHLIARESFSKNNWLLLNFRIIVCLTCITVGSLSNKGHKVTKCSILFWYFFSFYIYTCIVVCVIERLMDVRNWVSFQNFLIQLELLKWELHVMSLCLK